MCTTRFQGSKPHLKDMVDDGALVWGVVIGGVLLFIFAESVNWKQKQNRIREDTERARLQRERMEQKAIALGYSNYGEWQEEERKREEAERKRAAEEADKAEKKARAAEARRARKDARAEAESLRQLAKWEAEERVRREEHQKKIKEAKITAFGRKNFQSGFSYPTNSQKEHAWAWKTNYGEVMDGACVYCAKSAITVETSFWWRIFPELGVVTACDACAKGDGLVEEEPNEPQRSSRSISQEVKDRVWNRDKGKCTECGSNENLEFDHIIPHAKGGANTYRNIQLLCQDCNRRKSDNIG